MRNNDQFIPLLVLVAGIIIFVLFSSTIPSNLKQGSINSVSVIGYTSNTGEVRAGQLYGSKMVISGTMSSSVDEFAYEYIGKTYQWGEYTIKPKNNVRVQLSTDTKAESQLVSYASTYYTYGSSTYSMQDMKGSSRQLYSPVHIIISADNKAIPTTVVLDQTINVDSGQQMQQLSNGFNFQKTSFEQIGQTILPDFENIIVATTPSFADFQSKGILADYTSGKTLILSKSDYDTKITYFKDSSKNSWFYNYNDPQLAVWTGYDRFSYIGGICGRLSSTYKDGYCKIPNWNGLYSLSQYKLASIEFTASSNKLTATNIGYGIGFNLEIPSETLKSIAVLRGVGEPEVTLTTMPLNIVEGTSQYLIVSVKNIGDTDGFSITPRSKAGKLIFTPASYSSQYIKAGETKEFRFITSFTGQEGIQTTILEDTGVDVRAEHSNIVVTKSFKTTIQTTPRDEGKPIGSTPRTTPNVIPSDSDNMNLNNSGDSLTTKYIKWYETPSAYALGILLSVLIVVVYMRKKK